MYRRISPATTVNHRLAVAEALIQARNTFALEKGLTQEYFVCDLAYTFRTGTVHSTATDTSVHQHTLLASVIYHF